MTKTELLEMIAEAEQGNVYVREDFQAGFTLLAALYGEIDEAWDRATVEQGLKALEADGSIRLHTDYYAGNLTKWDHAAALSMGGIEYHMVELV